MKKFFLVDDKTTPDQIKGARIDGYAIADKAKKHLIPEGAEIVNAKKKPGPKTKNGDGDTAGDPPAVGGPPGD